MEIGKSMFHCFLPLHHGPYEPLVGQQEYITDHQGLLVGQQDKLEVRGSRNRRNSKRGRKKSFRNRFIIMIQLDSRLNCSILPLAVGVLSLYSDSKFFVTSLNQEYTAWPRTQVPKCACGKVLQDKAGLSRHKRRHFRVC